LAKPSKSKICPPNSPILCKILVFAEPVLPLIKIIFNLEPIFSKKIGSSYLQCFKKLLDPLK